MFIQKTTEIRDCVADVFKKTKVPLKKDQSTILAGVLLPFIEQLCKDVQRYQAVKRAFLDPINPGVFISGAPGKTSESFDEFADKLIQYYRALDNKNEQQGN